MPNNNDPHINPIRSLRPKKPDPSRPSDAHTRVVVVDDHPVIREALSTIIGCSMDMEFCGEAGSAHAAFQLVERVKPDVMVIDISLGDAHGLDLVKNLHALYPELQMVIFSIHEENAYATRAIRAGASGYVMKTAATQHIAEAIRTVAQGGLYLSQPMVLRLLNSMLRQNKQQPVTPTDELTEPVDVLTDRELEVFQMLGQGYSVPEIAERLNLCQKTIETYRRRAKEKLGFDTVAKLLHYAIEWSHESMGSPN